MADFDLTDKDRHDRSVLTLYLTLALGVSFICSLLESVLLSTTISHAHMLDRDGKKIGALWLRLKDHDAVQPLTAILTLNTIAHTVGALGVGVEVEAAFPGEYTVAVASALLTLAILLLSEILPKTLGAAYWKQFSAAAAHTLDWMVKLMWPFIALILVLKKMLPNADSQVITRDELAALADIGEAHGAIAEGEEAVITNLLQLRDRKVRDIMTPRVVVTSWSADYTVRQALDDVPRTLFSRIPLIGDSLDDLRGFVLRKDVLLAAADGEWDRPLTDFVKASAAVPSDQNVERLFHDLMREQSHFAVVQDEFGGTAGLVTLEDVLEAILGAEIVDEHDEVENMRELARQQAEGRDEA